MVPLFNKEIDLSFIQPDQWKKGCL